MTTEDTPTPEPAKGPGEPGEMSERTAKAVLAGVGMLAGWGVVVAVPETAYVVTGVLCTACWYKGRAWLSARRSTAAAGDDSTAPAPDVVAALHALSKGEHHVLLTSLRDHTRVPDTKAVRRLLDDAGVRVRAGVRSPHGNGPGVHKSDIPPLPSPESGTPCHGCSCSSGQQTELPTPDGDPPGEGLRVVPIGSDGKIIYDLSEATRYTPAKGSHRAT